MNLNSTDPTRELGQRISWRLSQQHQIALALLASLALAAIGLWYGWSALQGEQADVDQAERITLEFRVDINRADQGELMAIPSVGPKMAEAIVGYRDVQGPFRTFEQLQEVPGIGPKKLEQLVKYLLPIGK